MASHGDISRKCIQSRHHSSHQHPQAEPLQLTGVWQVANTTQSDALLGGSEPGFAYRRDGHPNAATLMEILRQLHSADKAILTAQGMSALAAVAMALLKPGDEVVLGQPVYGRTNLLFAHDLARWGIQASSIAANDLSQWRNILKTKPRLAILETITNPRMSVPDIESIARLCREQNTILLVDNTFATPALCRPIELGADLVMESLSKFVCGHSDAMLGLLCGRSDVWDRIDATVSTFGLASSPLDCWLTRRGLATLPLRMEQACKNAYRVATLLSEDPRVASVDYPGLPSHPQHDIATRQFDNRYGNMLCVHLANPPGDANEVNMADRWIQALAPDIPFCPSLGEVQTTLSHPKSTSHRSYNAQQLHELGISQNSVRISCGIEDSEWLCNRLISGLDRTA